VLIYAEGDLAAPEAMRAAATTVESVGAAGGELFVQNPDGSFAAPTSFLDVARVAVAVDFTRSSIEDATGVAITDEDSDGFPDNAEQVAAVFNYGLENGLPADENSFIFTADEVGQQVAELDSGWAAVMDFPLQGLGSSERVQSAREAVEAGEADFLSATSAAGLTMDTSISGSILTEQLRLDAITDSMVISVPLAMLLCLAVAGLVMRSLMISLVSVVPIILVIAWLLGFMYAFDYNLNVVTATIAAISVGVGIDYSIHFTMRYREELVRTGDRMEAAGGAASRTGTALVLSGATSIVGFLLLALAPMPVFAAYGLLTAMMIAFSLIAALTVLPALLSIVTPAAQTSSQASTVRAEA
jgi:predicted RND superfamily exporter protein